MRLVVVSAVPGGAFGAPQVLEGGDSGDAGIAVGGGRLAVAYRARGKVSAQTGAVGAALGPSQRLGSAGLGRIAVAVDDAGTATVAFDRGTTFDHKLVVTRARAGGRFGPPAVLARSRQEFGPVPQAAAAGTTTALIWTSPDAVPWVRAAIVRGTGRFAAADVPSGASGNPLASRLAVDREGGVLLTYTTFGSPGAVHATVRRAGAAGFGALHVVSRLGEGGDASVAWLSERRPLIIYHRRRRGELLASTRVTGPPPDLTPPRLKVEFTRGARGELRAANAVTVTIRCSEPCVLRTRAGLGTRQGRTFVGGVDGKILARGATFTERFAFDPEGRAGRAEGVARARVTVTAQNASGASTTVARQIDL